MTCVYSIFDQSDYTRALLYYLLHYGGAVMFQQHKQNKNEVSSSLCLIKPQVHITCNTCLALFLCKESRQFSRCGEISMKLFLLYMVLVLFDLNKNWNMGCFCRITGQSHGWKTYSAFRLGSCDHFMGSLTVRHLTVRHPPVDFTELYWQPGLPIKCLLCLEIYGKQ